MPRLSVRYSLALAALLVLGAPAALGQTSFTWNTTTGSWNTAANWLPATVPPSAATTQLTFTNAGAGYTSTNNIGAGTFTLNRMTFNNTGTGNIVIASAAAANTITFAGTNPAIDVQAGTVLLTGLLGGSPTITKTGAGTFIHDSSNAGFTGQLVINGGTFVNRATTIATTAFNPTLITVNNGATYQFGENSVGDPNLPGSTYITVNAGGTVNWQENESFGGVNLFGGSIVTNTSLGTDGTAASVLRSGTITGAGSLGGSAVINKTTAGTVSITDANLGATGAINIQEGLLTTTGTVSNATSAFTISTATTAGTFQYAGSAARTTTRPLALNGAATIDVANPAGVFAFAGAVSGAGPLTKTGAGTLNLPGALTQTGLTTAAAGTLRVNPVASAGGFTVADGATLAVNSGAAADSFSTPTLAFTGPNARLRLELNSGASSATPLVNVINTDGLSLGSGAVVQLVNAQAFAVGSTYTLIDYAGAPITGGVTLGPLAGRATSTLNYNTANTSIDLTITGADSIRWAGDVSSTWDVGSAPNVGGTNNWRLASNGAATNFVDADTVRFDDTAANFVVNIVEAVRPNPGSAIVVNTAGTYTFQGAGSIVGGIGLTKEGGGTLILATDNSYTGANTLAGGTLQIGTGGATGTLGGATTSIAEQTTLAFNRSTDSVYAGAFTLGEVTGEGTVPTITKAGSGELRLTGNSPLFTGSLVINGGSVRVADPLNAGNNFNAANIVVNSGGTFIFGDAGVGNPNLPDTATFVTLNAGGAANWQEGEQFGGVNLFGGTLTFNGAGVTFASPTASEWRQGVVNGTANVVMVVNAGVGVSKTTPGTVTVSGLASLTTPLSIADGRMVFATAANLGAGPVTFAAGAGTRVYEYQGATAAKAEAFTLAGAGTVQVSAAATALTLSGTLSGAAGLTKEGPGALVLTGNNTYAGATAVNGGSLIVNGQTGANSGTGTGTVTVNAGGLLAGTGRTGGSVALANGVIQGGNPLAAAPGTLSVPVGLAVDAASAIRAGGGRPPRHRGRRPAFAPNRLPARPPRPRRVRGGRLRHRLGRRRGRRRAAAQLGHRRRRLRHRPLRRGGGQHG